MVDECSGRGGRQAVALPEEILVVALEKEEATREKLLEMAMPVVQRERLERLDMFDMRMGKELIKQCSGDSSKPADIGPGREPRRGDAELQRVPDGADEADGSLNNANPESCTSGSGRWTLALARQTRARKAVEAADKTLTTAKQKMEETMEELEQANSAVERAKKKVGPAAGLTSDVTMLLELLKPHMNSLSINATDIVARIEGEVKVVRMRETRFKECASGRNASGNPTDAAGDDGDRSSRDGSHSYKAVEAMRHVEEEEGEKAKRARIDAGRSPKEEAL